MNFIYGAAYGAEFVKVPYNDDASFSLRALMQAVDDKTNLVILANPNSPFGDYKTIEELDVVCKFLNEKGILFLIDEAYVEFSQLLVLNPNGQQ